jgi:exodeoxyribonuclease VII large subunit
MSPPSTPPIPPSSPSTLTAPPPVLTVSELTNAIKHCLEGSFPSIWLEGEISNFKQQTSGHLYFTLKDSGAQISAVMFRLNAASLKKLPKDGDHVTIKGELNIYPPSGKYQIIVQELKQVGVGELLLKLEELKIKLHKMGWFKQIHKKPLPKLPNKIGVVTSPTGAAIQDILNILTRRFSGFELIINPVKVQGEGAAKEIADAIKFFNDYGLADVLIVGRGGGSIEDLFAFNEEIVAQAIFNSHIPIISAVGHETDHCIADYVADVRAPTPSAAAEIVIFEKIHMLERIEQIDSRLKQTVFQLIREQKRLLSGLLKQPVFASPYGTLHFAMQRLDDIKTRIDQTIKIQLSYIKSKLENQNKRLQSLKPLTKLTFFKEKIDALEKTLTQRMLIKLNTLKYEKLAPLISMLHAVDPKNVLTKGYCILFSEKDNSVITSVCAVEKQQDVRLILSDGELISTIKKINPT